MKNFDEFVDKSSGCWEWTGRVNKDGYGIFRGRLAHRVAYIEAYGPYPEGTVTDHICRVRHCVNPNHLEAVTIAENIARGLTGLYAKARHSAVVRCPQGHPLSGDNLYLESNRDGWRRRHCKTCVKKRRKEQYSRERETSRETILGSRETS